MNQPVTQFHTDSPQGLRRTYEELVLDPNYYWYLLSSFSACLASELIGISDKDRRNEPGTPPAELAKMLFSMAGNTGPRALQGRAWPAEVSDSVRSAVVDARKAGKET